jgi:hypothetical protein
MSKKRVLVRERYTVNVEITDDMEKNATVLEPGKKYAKAPSSSVLPVIKNAPAKVPILSGEDWEKALS